MRIGQPGLVPLSSKGLWIQIGCLGCPRQNSVCLTQLQLQILAIEHPFDFLGSLLLWELIEVRRPQDVASLLI